MGKEIAWPRCGKTEGILQLALLSELSAYYSSFFDRSILTRQPVKVSCAPEQELLTQSPQIPVGYVDELQGGPRDSLKIHAILYLLCFFFFFFLRRGFVTIINVSKLSMTKMIKNMFLRRKQRNHQKVFWDPSSNMGWWCSPYHRTVPRYQLAIL